jgi:DNA-binding IscR family transcriptional regulator
MRIGNRFSIAVHILSLLGAIEDVEHTSEWMAGSTGVNPVIVRNITGMLRRARLVRTSQGVKGARLARPLADITLLDVYRAVEADGPLFSIHPRPHPSCEVGSKIQGTLENVFGEAQAALEAKLAATSMQRLVRDLGKSGSLRRRA